MSGWANNDNYGQDPRFGSYYGQGYGGFGRQGYLGYYGGYDARNQPYPGSALGESGYYGEDEDGYPFYGSGTGQASAPRGPHAGKGPARSDDWIDDEVRRRLTENGELDARGVEVSVQNGEVTLSGSVADRYAKRTAEDVAESVPGVRDVHNRLTITRAGQGQSQSHTQAQSQASRQTQTLPTVGGASHASTRAAGRRATQAANAESGETQTAASSAPKPRSRTRTRGAGTGEQTPPA
jgi:hypothetical protein